jgi:hypothetical protein
MFADQRVNSCLPRFLISGDQLGGAEVGAALPGQT